MRPGFRCGPSAGFAIVSLRPSAKDPGARGSTGLIPMTFPDGTSIQRSTDGCRMRSPSRTVVGSAYLAPSHSESWREREWKGITDRTGARISESAGGDPDRRGHQPRVLDLAGLDPRPPAWQAEGLRTGPVRPHVRSDERAEAAHESCWRRAFRKSRTACVSVSRSSIDARSSRSSSGTSRLRCVFVNFPSVRV
jgi:hypothetical protein